MTYPIRVRAGAVIIEDESILLVEFHDEKGLHYNLPGGGVEENESIKEAVRREAKEEASVEVEVGPLAFVYEYAPHLSDNRFGKTHSLSMWFDCKISGGSTPRLPDNPDQNQTNVKWIPLAELGNIVLYPDIRDHIIGYAKDRDNTRINVDLVEEHLLDEYS